jgi:sulfite reductase (NADPH) hemoprotein beta-component
MYRYDEFDAGFVRERVAQFRDQVQRRLTGALTEDQFRIHRLMNGVYLQLHAYMLRIAIPYGTLSSRQMRKLAHISRVYDRGYGHFTTRQNLQFNWPALKDIPAILDELAEVEMHALQTSGNCIRNVTADHFAGAAADEYDDPRPYAEIVRQWSSIHPEFTYLPRKFKIAVTGADHDRAAIQVHDIGYQLKRNERGELGMAVYVGGGQGRTPMVAQKIRDFLPIADLLSYTEAIVRVYNMEGRRDNKYKARIKILVHEKGAAAMTQAVEAEFAKRDDILTLPAAEIERISAYFKPPALPLGPARSPRFEQRCAEDAAFLAFAKNNLSAHKQQGYTIITVSLKPIGGIPGDATAEQMERVAELAERYGFDEIRVSHEQNLVLPHVRLDDVPAVYDALREVGLASANAGLISDIICCPGLDYCSLATARSIPIAQALSAHFGDGARARDIGGLKIKISGCINACGHHHVGHIGILGLERKGVETYQLTLGGSGDESCTIGSITGPGFSAQQIVEAVEAVVNTYLSLRHSAEESFIETFRRVGMAPFKKVLYERDAGADI